jgi:hypothetical protein
VPDWHRLERVTAGGKIELDNFNPKEYNYGSDPKIEIFFQGSI